MTHPTAAHHRQHIYDDHVRRIVAALDTLRTGILEDAEGWAHSIDPPSWPHLETLGKVAGDLEDVVYFVETMKK